MQSSDKSPELCFTGSDLGLNQLLRPQGWRLAHLIGSAESCVPSLGPVLGGESLWWQREGLWGALVCLGAEGEGQSGPVGVKVMSLFPRRWRYINRRTWPLLYFKNIITAIMERSYTTLKKRLLQLLREGMLGPELREDQ